MDILNSILSTYASFFDWHMWVEVLSSPTAWGLILTLVIMEGLLSADNALVLAVMVKHLPESQRKKALMYGMIGAFFFRFLFIGIGVYIVQFWYIKVIGAAYLLFLVYKYFKDKNKDKDEESHEFKHGLLERLIGTFWATIVMVELMDLAFSVDSILAAFAISNEVWVLLVGGVLGIIMMRTIATMFLKLLEVVPELETTAYVLIAIIALKMLAGVLGYEMSHALFFIIVGGAFVITFIIHYINKNRAAAH